MDGAVAYTVRNLVARPFFNTPDVGEKLIRLGCLFSDAKIADPF